jgi:hypothetical protein
MKKHNSTNKEKPFELKILKKVDNDLNMIKSKEKRLLFSPEIKIKDSSLLILNKD